jgi:transketolase
MAVGLAMEKKLVFVYTITPFLLWRGAEVIRNYIHHEKIPVKLIASGRAVEYVNEGYSHHCTEDIVLFEKIFYNVKTYRPEKKEEIPGMFQEMVGNNEPAYFSLSRF